MKAKHYLFIGLLGAAIMSPPAPAQELIVYPAKGQNAEKMEKDKYECYQWAKAQTGFDPMQTPTASSPPPTQVKHSTGKRALRGGAVGGTGGAIIGGIADGSDGARKGAAIGGLSGGAIGGMRSTRHNRQIQQQQKQWEQEQANQYLQKRNTYNRANAACLEGRGYTVK